LGLVFVALIFSRELSRGFPQMYFSQKGGPFVHGAESELSLHRMKAVKNRISQELVKAMAQLFPVDHPI